MKRTDYKKPKKSIDNLIEQYRYFLIKEQQEITEVEKIDREFSNIIFYDLLRYAVET